MRKSLRTPSNRWSPSISRKSRGLPSNELERLLLPHERGKERSPHPFVTAAERATGKIDTGETRVGGGDPGEEKQRAAPRGADLQHRPRPVLLQQAEEGEDLRAHLSRGNRYLADRESEREIEAFVDLSKPPPPGAQDQRRSCEVQEKPAAVGSLGRDGGRPPVAKSSKCLLESRGHGHARARDRPAA
jgi:hypothetical protein